MLLFKLRKHPATVNLKTIILKNKQTFLAVAGIAALIIIVYGQTLFSSFHFDDRSSILNNPVLRSRTTTVEDLWQYWPTRFITTCSFYLNFRVRGLRPFGYHLVNILIHVINAGLVYFILLYSIERANNTSSPAVGFPACAGAMIFALNPLQTQGVSYIAQRAASLAASFYLTGLLCYIRADRRRGEIFYPLAWAAGAAAMFCKEMAVSFPLAVILWDLIFRKDSSRRRGRRWFIFLLLILIIPLTVMLHSANPKYNDSGQIGITAGKGFEKVMGGVEAPDRASYAITQIRVFVTYLRLTILPIRQNLDYDFPVFFRFFQWRILLSLITILSLIIFSVFLLRRKKILGGFGIIFFISALLPESSFIPIRDVIFEHRLYLPLLGLAFLTAQFSFSSRRQRVRFGLIILFLATLTLARNRVWMDEITLWTDTVGKSPGKGRPRNNLGYLYNREARYAEARGILSRAIEIAPAYPEAMVNLAISRKNLEELAEAEELCREALALRPAYPEGHNTLGDILRLRGRIQEAEESYRRALDLNPALAEARNNLANLYQEMGRPELAAAEYRRALGSGEENPVYLNNLGLNLLEEGRIEEAIRIFRRAIDRDRRLAPAHYNLGNALFREGDLPEAEAAFKEAVGFNPGYARAFFNLGVVQSRLESWDNALASFLAVIELDPDSAPAHLKAGLICLLHRNDPEKAAGYLQRALELDPELPGRERIERLLKEHLNPDYSSRIRDE